MRSRAWGSPTVSQAYADTVHALGGARITPDEVLAAWHLGPTPVVLKHFLGRRTSPEDIECFHDRFERAVAAVRPFPGIQAMLDTLHDVGYHLGVYTSATRRAAMLLLGSAALHHRFRTVVCGDEVSRPKPAPHGLRVACRSLGVGPAEAAYVGDAEVDLRCARSAGARAIHAAWGAPAPPGTVTYRVARRPDGVLAHLR